MIELVTDFTTTARCLAKAIVADLYFPPAQKTIKPLASCKPKPLNRSRCSHQPICYSLRRVYYPGYSLSSCQQQQRTLCRNRQAYPYHLYLHSKSSFLGPVDGAAKVMGHEVRGLLQMITCVIEEKISDLYFPLTCIVDYRGFRVLGTIHTKISIGRKVLTIFHAATACLPEARTLVYGSNDGGDKIRWYDDQQRGDHPCLLDHLIQESIRA